MVVNRYKFNINTKNPQLQLGFITTFDETGREDLIKKYEDNIVRALVNPTKDYEVSRFRHAPLFDNSEESPDIFYQFNFDDPTNPSTWPVTLPAFAPTVPLPFGYNFKNYSNLEVAENTSDLQKSFFKLDFFDSPNRTKQKFYMSNILNPVMGTRYNILCVNTDCIVPPSGNPWGDLNLPEPDVPIESDIDGDGTMDFTVVETAKDMVIPRFQFDMDKKNSGYFFFWLKGDTLLSINKFYMTCKFYNGRDGSITRFTNVLPTSTLPTQNAFQAANFLYYTLKLDKSTFTYWVEDMSGNRVGTSINNPIEFWEYNNPA